MTSLSVAYLGFGKGGGHGERAESEAITGVWGRSPQRGPGAEPLVGGSGKLENGNKRTFSYKVACKKFSWSGQRGGYRTMAPLSTPLG